MRNSANKMTNPIDPYTENHFLSFIDKSERRGTLCGSPSAGSHWLRRPLHGSLHRSCVVAVYPTLELICDFRPSKFSQYPSRYPKFLSLPDPIPSRSQKPLPVRAWLCGEKSVMWRNFRFLCVTNVEKSEISPYLSCENFST